MEKRQGETEATEKDASVGVTTLVKGQRRRDGPPIAASQQHAIGSISMVSLRWSVSFQTRRHMLNAQQNGGAWKKFGTLAPGRYQPIIDCLGIERPDNGYTISKTLPHGTKDTALMATSTAELPGGVARESPFI